MSDNDEDDISDIVSEEEEEEVEMDLSNSDVVTKYQFAAGIVETAMTGVITQCVAGKSIVDVCNFGDSLINQQCGMVFKSKKVEKGVAFPTCISVNECVCHASPLSSESAALKAGDMVKIDLGCHIDGFIALAAHTIVLPKEGEELGEITGPQADVMMAAHTAAEAAYRLMKPGNKNVQVTEAIKKVAESFGVQPVAGTLMHQMKRFVIDGNKVVLQREEVDQKVEEYEFEVNEVYTVDICMSTGEGKPRESEERTTVFKRAVDKSYRLKMKASRYVLTEVNTHFPTLPFTIRALGDEKQGRMGVVECLKHDLLHPYPVLYERPGDQVAHVKFTVLLLPSGTTKITMNKIAFPMDQIKSEKTVEDEEILAMLAAAKQEEEEKEKKKKKKNKKKKKKKTAAAGSGEGNDED